VTARAGSQRCNAGARRFGRDVLSRCGHDDASQPGLARAIRRGVEELAGAALGPISDALAKPVDAGEALERIAELAAVAGATGLSDDLHARAGLVPASVTILANVTLVAARDVRR